MLLNWMNEALDEFVAQTTLTKSKLTVEAYQLDVSQFLLFLKEKGVKRVSSLRPEHVASYLSYQKNKGKSDSSINRYYMSLRSFCRFLRRSKRIVNDLILDLLPPPAVRQQAPHIPTKEEVARILEQPDTETEAGLRDKAILELLYSSGLRATELCDLRLEDFKGDSIVVKCGKGGKTRTVPMTSNATTCINAYLEKRGKRPGILFQTLLGKQLRRQVLCKVVIRHAKRAGLEDITTHTLRHACATHLLDEGADIRLIQEVLGHGSISSTQRYTHLSSNKIQFMFQKFHPRKTEMQQIGV